METIELHVDKTKMDTLLKKLQLLKQEGLIDTFQISLSFQEAKGRVAEAVERYQTDPDSFSEIDKKFFDETKGELLKRFYENR